MNIRRILPPQSRIDWTPEPDRDPRDKTIPKLPEGTRDAASYFDGRVSFQDGKPVDSNPNDSRISTRNRISWFTGWHDAKYEKMFPQFFGPQANATE